MLIINITLLNFKLRLERSPKHDARYIPTTDWILYQVQLDKKKSHSCVCVCKRAFRLSTSPTIS